MADSSMPPAPLPGAKLIKQGAEARIFQGIYCGQETVIKQRFPKTYRHPTLDQKLIQKRGLQEVRAILRCSKLGIDVPALYLVDMPNHSIYMENVDGLTVREIIESYDLEKDAEKVQSVAQKVGNALGALHKADIVHGDLTTSNMLIRNSTSSLVMIDFGLSYTCKLPEDKAVDLYVLERAFLSTHPNTQKLFQFILDVYRKSHRDAPANLARLEVVRTRGRKKLCFG